MNAYSYSELFVFRTHGGHLFCLGLGGLSRNVSTKSFPPHTLDEFHAERSSLESRFQRNQRRGLIINGTMVHKFTGESSRAIQLGTEAVEVLGALDFRVGRCRLQSS